MTVKDPPVCSRCVDEPESVTKLEQHVRTPRKNSRATQTPKGLLDGTSERLSLTYPLNPDANRIGPSGQTQQIPPAWMTLLPSKRLPGASPPGRSSSISKRNIALEHNKEPSNPFITPPQSPKTTFGDHRLGAPSRYSLSHVARGTPLASPKSMMTLDIPTIDEDSIASSDQKEPEVTGSRRSSPSQPQSPVTPRSTETKASRSGSPNRIRRSFSMSKGISGFRRSSTGRPARTPVILDPQSPHSSMPSQKVAPTKAPFFKELVGFFSSRSKTGKLPLPSRVDGNRSTMKFDDSGGSTPGQYGLERTCARCGVDMSDWWIRRESNTQVLTHDGGGRRICDPCKAAEKLPATMPGGWE